VAVKFEMCLRLVAVLYVEFVMAMFQGPPSTLVGVRSDVRRSWNTSIV